MNTQTISQFELLDTELLATVEGGLTRCQAGVYGGAISGAVGVGVALALASNPVGWGVGTLLVGGGALGGGLTGAAGFCY